MPQSRLPPTTRTLQTSDSALKVKAGDKWLLMGTSGSGKTTAAKLLDRSIARLYPDTQHYVLDTKHDGDFHTYPNIIESNKAPNRMKPKEKYQVWQPLLLYPDEVEKWLWMVFNSPPALLWINELYALKYKGVGNYSDMYAIIQRAGRTKPITCLTETQKLGKIPPDAIEQATHRLGFYMEGTYNKLVRSQMLKGEKVPNPIDTYGFHYQHWQGRGEPPYYRNIQEFLNMR